MPPVKPQPPEPDTPRIPASGEQTQTQARTSSRIQQALESHFGFSSFREGQAEVIHEVLAGRDTLAVMPTGGGKSLCYQLPALLRDGVTLVISPLIALMHDQVEAMAALGSGLGPEPLPGPGPVVSDTAAAATPAESPGPPDPPGQAFSDSTAGALGRAPSTGAAAATYINSTLSPRELDARLRGLAAGRYRLVFVAPERFRSPRFLEALRRVQVWLFAVDEAHCVSMWGHDFRPDYLQLGRALRALGEPQVLALTATATPEVRKDIITQLGLGQAPRVEPAVVVRGFGRPGLTLVVRRVAGRKEKTARLTEILDAHGSGIVYCATRRNVEWVAAELAAQGRRGAGYHAGLPAEVRRRVQERFVAGELDVVAATNAFGMGIDRADVRSLTHWDVPGSLEAYYQEAGRAGRDGAPAHCELLFNQADVRTQEFFIEGSNPPPELVCALAAVVRAAGPTGLSVEALLSQVDSGGGRRVDQMAVSTALGTLERWGALARGGDPPERWLPGTRPESPTGEELDLLRLKAARDRARLQRLLRYVQTTACRHATILRYFGDPDAEGVCGNRCDRCLSRGAGRRLGRPPTEAQWVEVQKVLSAVARLRGRFGRSRVIQLLAGSRDRKVLEARLDHLPTYGSLRGTSQARIRGLLDALEDAGCVCTVGTDYPKVQLTEQGRRVMRREAEVWLDLPAPADTPLRNARPSRGETSTGRPEGSPGSRRAEQTGKTPASAQDEGPVDAALFDRLRAWRLEQARARGVPAYVVFHDATLRRIAHQRPADEAALLSIKGVGPAKVEAYGASLLTLLFEKAAAPEDDGDG
jgi:ATP-dependent DNA helicase RecQ